MRLIQSFAVAIAAATLVSSPAQAQSKPSDLQSAEALLRDGKNDQALALVNGIIEKAMLKEAKDPSAICPAAAVAFLQNYMKGNFTVSVENDWCEAMMVKGYALNELKRSPEAEQVLASLVGHDPTNPHYLIEYAYTVRVNGNLARSLELYKKAEKLASDLKGADGMHWRAAALRGEGYDFTDMQQWDDATKAYQLSLKYEPGNDIARHELDYIEQHRLAQTLGNPH